MGMLRLPGRILTAVKNRGIAAGVFGIGSGRSRVLPFQVSEPRRSSRGTRHLWCGRWPLLQGPVLGGSGFRLRCARWAPGQYGENARHRRSRVPPTCPVDRLLRGIPGAGSEGGRLAGPGRRNGLGLGSRALGRGRRASRGPCSVELVAWPEHAAAYPGEPPLTHHQYTGRAACQRRRPYRPGQDGASGAFTGGVGETASPPSPTWRSCLA